MIYKWNIRKLDFLSIYFKGIVLVIDNSNDFIGCLPGMLNFQERMIMRRYCFTVFAQIKVSTNCAFVSDSFDFIASTIITNDMRMNNRVRDFRFFDLWLLMFFLFRSKCFSYLLDELGHHFSELLFNHKLADFRVRIRNITLV